MNSASVGAAIIQWAETEPTVTGLVLIGSQVHAGRAAGNAADAHSDWDFQVITTHPALFAERSWLRAAGLGEPLAYAKRVGRLGTANKVSVVLASGELDLVVIPENRLAMVKVLIQFGLFRWIKRQKDFVGMSVVLRAGHRVVKGVDRWADLFSRIAREVSPLRLCDDAIRELAEAFVSDYVSTCRKLARGEYLAAQRWLHMHLVETNFRLLHELRQRQGHLSLPDARRIEVLADAAIIKALSVESSLDSRSLEAAADKSAQTCRDLVHDLLGDSWRWPELPSSLRRE